MFSIRFLYKFIFYLLICGLSVCFFVSKLATASTSKSIGKQYTVLDVSKVNLSPSNIKNIDPSPFFEVIGQTPPGTPIVPGQPNGKGASNDLVILGVLPPDVVILRRGGKTLTAKTGEDTFAGVIGKVYLDGAWINNVFIPLKK